MRQVIYYQGHRYTRHVWRTVTSSRSVTTVTVHVWGPRYNGVPFHLISERSHYGAPSRAVPKDAGCYVDGHWGQYAVAHMVSRAEEFGYDNPEVIALADRHMDECTHGGITHEGIQPLTDDEHEILIDASDEVENWLNEHIAPEGYFFGWHDGEFFLQSQEWWDE